MTTSDILWVSHTVHIPLAHILWVSHTVHIRTLCTVGSHIVGLPYCTYTLFTVGSHIVGLTYCTYTLGTVGSLIVGLVSWWAVVGFVMVFLFSLALFLVYTHSLDCSVMGFESRPRAYFFSSWVSLNCFCFAFTTRIISRRRHTIILRRVVPGLLMFTRQHFNINCPKIFLHETLTWVSNGKKAPSLNFCTAMDINN